MSWRDRDYNRGGEAMSAFLMNPGSIFGLSVPVLRTPTLVIRLHFWLLLFIFFDLITTVGRGAGFTIFLLDTGILLALLLWHEFGHRVVARLVDGDHREWVLWPLGGMVPPYASNRPWDMFWANAGGIVFTIPIGVLAFAALWMLTQGNITWMLVPSPFRPVMIFNAADLMQVCLSATVTISVAITAANLFPAYWFDGGYIWQALLTPKAGPYRAISITCIAGMVLSVPFFLLTLFPRPDLLGLIVWVLIFAGCYQRRKALQAAGPGVVEEEYSGVKYDYMGRGDDHPKKRKRGGWWVKNARKKARQDQAEQEKIDRILEKVKNHGLHSLSWWEKRTLRKATERQRQQDLVNK